MFETNVLDEVYRKYDDLTFTFCELEKKSAKLKILELEDVSGTFLLLVVGILVAFFAFLMENILHRIAN